MNYEYVIVKHLHNGLLLKDKTTKLKPDATQQDKHPLLLDVDIATIKNNFIFNHCRTAHSMQGASVDEPITIFDWDVCYICRRWIWASITRCPSLDNAFFVRVNLMIVIIMITFYKNILI